MPSTSGRLFDRYNTLTRRPTVQDPATRKVVFKSLSRVLGPWLPVDRQSRILDVGCGEGSLLSFLQECGYRNLDGFDISPENVDICHKYGFTFVQQFDALRLAKWTTSERYGAIFALDILEHLPKQTAGDFLQQIRQLLEPGGYAVLQTPNMGCVFGGYHRYNDLSHEYSLTEKSAIDLLMLAGFQPEAIVIRPAWNATTTLGHIRELYMRLLHTMVFLAEDSSRPRIPTKNLLIRAVRT